MAAQVEVNKGDSSNSLFRVYLRLRPPKAPATTTTTDGLGASAQRFITVEPAAGDDPSAAPTRITLSPPNDRRRAVENFAFTQVLGEDATQLDVFKSTNVVSLVQGVLAPHGGHGTDALLATLGVSGSGKSHTILGSRSQRGMVQLSLDLIFRSIGENITDIDDSICEASIRASDVSEANISSASAFIETTYGDSVTLPRPLSRAQTPPNVRARSSFFQVPFSSTCDAPRPSLFQSNDGFQNRVSNTKSASIVLNEGYPLSPSLHSELRRRDVNAVPHGSATINAGSRRPLQVRAGNQKTPSRPSPKHFMSVTASAHQRKKSAKTTLAKGNLPVPPTCRRRLTRLSALPQDPDISGMDAQSDPTAEYAVLISMYEVYNDRIFDLLTAPVKSASTQDCRRRPLLFKSTELSPDRKIVAGLRKIVCNTLAQALVVIEAGLQERRVTGTSSNSESSRSHAFLSIEIKKRKVSISKRHQYAWGSNTMTIVDLAGSERARDAKTAGATLAEAGKINESLMYLGQCLQMQSDVGNNARSGLVPFRQCKLTELLFSNSFASSSLTHTQSSRRDPQTAVMIVTADAHGDYNATSQILRYSALAREVTVPRIPSITEMMARVNSAQEHASGHSSSCSSSSVLSPIHTHRRPPDLPLESTPRSAHNDRSFSPLNITSEGRITMEHAALEIARLSEEVHYFRDCLSREQESRVLIEAQFLSLEEKMLQMEQVVREDCVAEFEQRLAVELARWKAAMQIAIERGEEHWDRKMEVFERSLALQRSELGANNIEGDDKENILVEDLQQENERLRREVSILKRELAGRSPTKRTPLMDREDFVTSVESSPRSTTSRQTCRNLQDKNDAGEVLQRRMESLTIRASHDELRNMRKASGSGKANWSMNHADTNGSPLKMASQMNASVWEDGLESDDPF